MEFQTNTEMEFVDEEFDVLTVDKYGKISNRQKQHCKKTFEDLGNNVLLEMVLIPAGIFGMGTAGYSGYDDEHPYHQVRISSFLMSKYPITQEQWKAVMKREPPYRCKGLKRPVDRVSWKDAIEFCLRLSKRKRNTYRLPSEAEWEYACRAGTRTPFAFGETVTTELVNFVGEHTHQLEDKGVYRHESTEVGSFPPNAFGLYDMHGNVWEWCADDWHDDYNGSPIDGNAWVSGKRSADKVMRGGSWHEPPGNCRSATRLKMNEKEAEDFFGFRVAISALN